MRTKYFYFGGYVGEGNISARINYTGTLDNVKIELTSNRDFDIYINDVYSGHYANSTSDLAPAEYYLGAYEGNFHSGENIIKFSANNLHIAGGYIRITYADGDYFETNQKRYYFPGIQGLINLYDGFYIPNALTSMKIFLHMNTEYTTFLTIGNTTVFRNRTTGEQTITINDADLSSMLDYGDLINKTIPIRLGLENVSYIGLDIDIDSILVTDVSGSMEWCASSGETGFSDGVWTDDGEVFCGDRRYLINDCTPLKIKSAKEAEKAFVSALLANNGPRIGIAEYSDGRTVKKTDTDLTTKFYIGTDPDCYEPDWFEADYNDNSWEDDYPYLYPTSLDNCDYCRGFFRKKFQATNLDEINYLKLYLNTDEGNICFINGYEIGNRDTLGEITYDVPLTILNEGENILACSVHERTSNFKFYPRLYTDKGDFIPDRSPIPEYSNDASMVLHYSFEDDSTTVFDSSNYGNNGSATNYYWDFGEAADFQGSKYISVPNNPSVTLVNDLTIEMWINPGKIFGQNNMGLIDKGLYTSWTKWGEFTLTLNSGSNKGGLIYSHNGYSWTAFDANTIKNNEWQHIVITREASTRTLKSYYNGQPMKTTTYASNQLPQAFTSWFYVGRTVFDTYDGKMDEVILYNEAVEDSEVLSHYNSATVPSGKIKRKTVYQCADTTDPKYARARRNTETDFTFVATLKNSGKATTTPINVSFYKDSVSPGNIIGSTIVDGIEAWGLGIAKINWTATLSSNTLIYVVADNENVVAEFNEGNNHANQWIYVYDFVGNDLDVTSFSYSPSFCDWSARTYTLSATVKNIGSLDIPGNFDLTFFKDSIAPGNEIQTVVIDGLDAGQSKSKSINWYADLSENTLIYAYADYPNIISEGSESNNDYTRTIIKSATDLYVNSIYPNNTNFCSPGEIVYRNVTVQGRAVSCDSGANSDLSLSQTRYDYSNWQSIPSFLGYITKYFEIPINTPSIGQKVYLYGYIDKATENVVESSETNNEKSVSYDVGPNLEFIGSIISIYPNPIVENNLTNVTLGIWIQNKQCNPSLFKFGYYHDSIAPGNLIYTEDVTFAGAQSKYISTVWETTLSSDTTIYAVIDYNNDVQEYNEGDNIKTGVIDVEPFIIEASFLPYQLFNFDYNPLLLGMLGLSSSSCVGTNYNLFQPDSSIARTKELSDNEAELNSFIDDIETWWGTCICCGINKASDMLLGSLSPSKFMVVMSDGEANIECSEQGTGNAKQDAIQAACDAYNDYGIKVYSVCFGGDCDTSTLQSIATCGNGEYYYGDVDDLISIYEEIAQDIINVSYTEQTAVGSAGIITTLYPDSYIEFDFTEKQIPYGLVLNPEKKFTDSSTGVFDLPPKSSIIDAKVISYSGPRWTDRVLVNNMTAYNLSVYGSRYTELGDPYHINLPLKLINNSNIIKLTTGLSSENSSEGSVFNKIVYQIVKNATSYSTISASAEGCIWTIDFEDNTNLTINIPYNYTGEDVCYYQDNREEYNGNDALERAAYYLLQQLDFDLNGKADVKFLEQDLVISSSEIVGIPFGWSTEVQVRKWH